MQMVEDSLGTIEPLIGRTVFRHPTPHAVCRGGRGIIVTV